MTAASGPTPASPSPAEQPAEAAAPPEGNVAAIEAVRARFGDALVEAIVFRGETTLVVRKEPILELLAFLRNEPALRFDRLSDLTAVDYLGFDQEPRFGVIYQLQSRETLQRLRLRALVPEEDPFIATVVEQYPVANWLEREVYDMFGIGFLGHPNLTRILMPEDWEGHPLRKDFPLGSEEISFSFNIAAAYAPGTQPESEGEARYEVSAHTSGVGGYEPIER
jgi:NADH-quinone oxidoreductase subunit C